LIYIFDASFVASLIIPDEKNPAVDKIYANIRNEDEKLAPHLFRYEIANIFKNIIRRKRFTFDDVLTFFPSLSALSITCDFETGPGYSEKLLRLCNDYNLSSYNASYLELAERKRAALCTLDDNLIAAAKKRGVMVME
jgi:predicted nucleic acid-binding protein